VLCAVRTGPLTGVRGHPLRRGDSFGRAWRPSQTPDPASRDARYRRIPPNVPHSTQSRRSASVENRYSSTLEDRAPQG